MGYGGTGAGNNIGGTLDRARDRCYVRCGIDAPCTIDVNNALGALGNPGAANTGNTIWLGPLYATGPYGGGQPTVINFTGGNGYSLTFDAPLNGPGYP